MNKIEVYLNTQTGHDRLLKALLENDLKNFKATRGRFLSNNPNKKNPGKLFA